DRLDADRPTAEIRSYRQEIAPVELVEAERIDFQSGQRFVGNCPRHLVDARHGSEVAHPAKQAAGYAWGAAGAAGNLCRSFVRKREAENARGAPNEGLEFPDGAEIERDRYTEAVAQRCREKAEPGRRGDEGEAGKIDLDGARRGPLADDEVELKVLHGRIEDFLHRRIETVDFVDEEHVALLEVGEQRRQIARLGDYRARGGPEIDAEFARHDL